MQFAFIHLRIQPRRNQNVSVPNLAFPVVRRYVLDDEKRFIADNATKPRKMDHTRPVIYDMLADGAKSSCWADRTILPLSRRLREAVPRRVSQAYPVVR